MTLKKFPTLLQFLSGRRTKKKKRKRLKLKEYLVVASVVVALPGSERSACSVSSQSDFMVHSGPF